MYFGTDVSGSITTGLTVQFTMIFFIIRMWIPSQNFKIKVNNDKLFTINSSLANNFVNTL